LNRIDRSHRREIGRPQRPVGVPEREHVPFAHVVHVNVDLATVPVVQDERGRGRHANERMATHDGLALLPGVRQVEPLLGEQRQGLVHRSQRQQDIKILMRPCLLADEGVDTPSADNAPVEAALGQPPVKIDHVARPDHTPIVLEAADRVDRVTGRRRYEPQTEQKRFGRSLTRWP